MFPSYLLKLRFEHGYKTCPDADAATTGNSGSLPPWKVSFDAVDSFINSKRFSTQEFAKKVCLCIGEGRTDVTWVPVQGTRKLSVMKLSDSDGHDGDVSTKPCTIVATITNTYCVRSGLWLNLTNHLRTLSRVKNHC